MQRYSGRGRGRTPAYLCSENRHEDIEANFFTNSESKKGSSKYKRHEIMEGIDNAIYNYKQQAAHNVEQ